MRDNLLSTSTSSILLFAVFLTFSSSLCRGFFSSSFVRKLPYRQATTVFLGSYRGNNDVEGEKSMWDATAGNFFEGRIPATRKVASLTSSSEAAIKKAKSSQLNAAENGRGGGGINVKDDIAGDKLVWDSKAGRFFEAKIDGIQEEEFCLLDPTNGKSILLTREEKERIFLDSIQSYYFSGKTSLSDEQFNQLKDDLSWEGSVLVTLNRNETLFINAVQAYNKGKPILTNPQFDDLKRSLKENNSPIAVDVEPKCYVDTGVCKVTWVPDNIKTGILYVPATLISTTIYLGVLYELLNGLLGVGLNPLITLAIGALPISSVSKGITENIFFKDPLVATGPCPSCGVENKVFFGDVLGVEGDKDESTIKCSNCKTSLTIKRSTLRVSTLMPKGGAAAKINNSPVEDD